MRILLALLVAVAIAALGALALAALGALALARGDQPVASDTGAVTLVGDSLNVGIEPYLRESLPGWQIDARDRVGRTTSEGVEQLRQLDGELAPVVVVSLGTNDADGSEMEFGKLVAEAIEIVGLDRCLVWATIVRDGFSRTGFDLVLQDARSAEPNVRLVEWGRMVAEDGSLLAADLVHGTPEGYRQRAEETARVARACSRSGG